ncbi:MAG: gliding motility-associated ABC transporter ATP-binding subunit GldA [Chitinophagales bacterium]|mgnify:FL=1|jgi:ABC-2 type transport system ATP-binding protein|nr:gliding motility-associated ABC transporter ATP-binding subunit GldA [Bacteroidota bacterium]MBK9556361.1 gliding motility-associated ABC transporter ATP-binding subunit GldA [Bacteroidota bacterium]MBL0280796.1 gliding motility-associated ABC transporter ATP-binding subunit GldA [Bacteroidota bacterium]MBP8248674.1 gliding motility-associated ABC transporter ATP-binding subunit GldA [Chitinophagales bacterium]MBP9879537.1 gliding motility-associated ABC transporter ATP-binding subunit GldA 
MSIIVDQLTKVYGEQTAVNQISFSVQSGEIVGFLGPNGAGKSTTMKMLTCFIPQTSGKASVCGFDTEKNSLDVRRNVGYLPEHNPLYPEMYVKEYLEFAARLNGMKNADKRIEDMIAMTGLTLERRKKIGQLSKGYRQRVGLAQAMLHDPKVLIMDEPTSGLDPNQLAEVRSLIKNIGKEKTVILSTHIMQEVQAICSRVIIINKGKIVADDSVDGIQAQQKGTTIIQVEFKEAVNQQLLKQIAGVRSVKGDTKLVIEYYGDADIREYLFRFAVENKYTLLNMHIEKQNLEDVFHDLTK